MKTKIEQIIPFTFKELEEKEEFKLDKEVVKRLKEAIEKDKRNGINIDLRKKIWNEEGKIKWEYNVELR